MFPYQKTNNYTNKYYLFKLLVLQILFCFLISCEKNIDKSELYIFFDELSDEIDKTKINQFKNSELDSAGNTIKSLFEDIEQKLNQTKPKERFDHLVNNGPEKISDSTRVMYLTIAYHLYLNNLEIHYDIMKRETSKIIEYEYAKQ